jgi:hypothetical protein
MPYPLAFAFGAGRGALSPRHSKIGHNGVWGGLPGAERAAIRGRAGQTEEFAAQCDSIGSCAVAETKTRVN